MQEIKTIKGLVSIHDYISVFKDIDKGTKILSFETNVINTYIFDSILDNNQILVKRANLTYDYMVLGNDRNYYIEIDCVRTIDLPKETYTQQELPFKTE